MDPNQVPQSQPTASPVAAPTPVSQPTSGNQWPGAFGIYKASSEAVKFNLKTNLVLALIVGALSMIGNSDTSSPTSSMSLVSLIAAVFSIIFSVSLIASTNASARSQKFSLSQAFSKGFSFLAVKYFAQAIVIVLMLLGSLVALIVPFFFVLPRLLLAPYYLVDKDMGPVEAIKESWAQTKGHSAKAWGIVGVTLLMSIAIIVLVGIYFLFMYLAAYSLFYLYVSGQQAAQPVVAAAAQSPLSGSPTDGPITNTQPTLQ